LESSPKVLVEIPQPQDRWQYLSAWAGVSILIGTVEAQRAIGQQWELYGPQEQRLTFLVSVLIQLFVLGLAGGALESVQRLLGYPPRSWRTVLPPVLSLSAHLMAVGIFLPLGLFINIRYLGKALSFPSLAITLCTFLACLVVFHLAAMLIGLIMSKVLPERSTGFFNATALGIALVCLISGLVQVQDGASGPASRSAKPGAPNLLLLTLDTTRADHVLPAGELGPMLCPELNRFFEKGFVFTRAYVPIPNTIASHATMFTGLYPSSHGVLTNRYRLTDEVTTLAEGLQAQGYRTGAFVSSYVLEPGGSGMHRGFEWYDHDFFASNLVPHPVSRLTPVHILSRLGVLNLLERNAEEVTGKAIDWLGAVRSPFYLWVHYWDPHRPYAPPESFVQEQDPDYEGSLPVDRFTLILQPDDYWDGRPRDAEHFMALYAAEIRFMDSQIGRLLDALADQGLLENTVVLAVADHGEALGERENYFKHSTLFEHDTHVPMFLYVPTTMKESLGLRPRQIPEVVETVDILPTLIELLEFPLEISYPLQGESLLPLLRQDPSAAWKNRALLELPDAQGYVMDNHKWIVDGGKNQEWLFDL